MGHEITIETETNASLEELSEAIAEQMILGDVGDDRYGYLASLALECGEDSDYDVTDTLMEYIRHARAYEDLSLDECNQIEAILRGEQ